MADAPPTPPPSEPAGWTFLTNHAHVLVCLTQRPDDTLREVARRVGITERAVQRIIRELEDAGILQRSRSGRRNTYTVNGAHPLRHPLEAHRSVQELLTLLTT